MRISLFPPSAELSPFVRTFTIVESADAVTRTLLPESGLVLGIRYGGFARQLEADPERNLPDATLAGLRVSARRMYTSANAGIVLATFHASAAAAFFTEPLHELFGKTIALDGILSAAEVARTTERVSDARDHAGRVRALEQLLIDRLRRRRADRVVNAAVAAMQRAHGALRIDRLSESVQLSRDRFEKRFRAAVGATPKQFASVLRLKRAIELYRSGNSLTQAALDAGYFDQSHFIREFRAFMGQAPGAFLRGVEHC